VIYGLINLVLTAFSLAGNMHVGQLMWIEHPDFPGGPLAYYANNIFWITILGNAAIIAGNYMNDALLVLCSFFLCRIYSLTFCPRFCQLHRCYIIWGGNWRVVVAPFIIYLGTIGISIFD
jgi:hypothetical protein